MDEKTRIKDIAEKAGVSTGTVDRVLHNRGNVSNKAREKVMAVMRELDYEPNYVASALAYNRTIKIASLLPSHEADIYWAQPRTGIERAMAALRHYGFAHAPYSYDTFSTDSFQQQAARLLADEPDALLLAPVFLGESLELLGHCEARGIPVVAINADLQDERLFTYVGQDSYQSGVLGGKLLDFGLNRNESAMLLNLGSETSNAQHVITKEKGFRDYFSGRYQDDVRIIKAEFAEYEDKAALRDFLLDKLGQHPSLRGIFVINSRAYKVVDCLDEDTLSRIKIVGFDLIAPNLQYLRDNKISFLINQNPMQQGYLGITSIANLLFFKKEVPKLQYLPLDIVVNENVAYYLKQEDELLPVL